jgi:hypothetical protein
MDLKENIVESKMFTANERWKEGFNYYISFFLWPFGVTLAALRHWDRPWSKNVFWLFCIFLGFTFIIAEEGGADSDRYARLFVHYAHSNLSLAELWSSFYSETSSYVDIFSPLITYLVSRLTDNPIALFIVFALIFGYFFSRNIWFVLERLDGKITLIVFIYILTFALINPIWNINGFRFNVAAQVFLFGALPFVLEGNRKSLIWSGVSIFFHFSFMLPVTILFVYIILRNRLNIYFVFFIISAFIKEIDLLYVRSLLLLLPDIFHSKVINYTNPEYAEALSNARQMLNWYVPLSNNAIKWVVYGTVVYIYFFARHFLKERKDLTSLMSFSLLLYGFANIVSLIPIMGRFIMVSNTFMYAFIILFITSFPSIKGMTLINVLSLPFILLFCAVSIRIGMDYYGLMAVLGNPFIAAFYSDTTPMITSIKRLL